MDEVVIPAYRPDAGSWLAAGRDRHPGCVILAGFHPAAVTGGTGLTPWGRAGRAALAIFTLAAVAALLSSGWNNRQLLLRVGADIARYERIAMDDYGAKASAVRVLREDAALLDSWARNGVPLRLSLGLYRGERIRLPLLEAIRRYVPPPPPRGRCSASRRTSSALTACRCSIPGNGY